MEKKGLIFDIQRFSLHNGPGIRTTVFFKGCRLACLWCHNPESVGCYPELMFTRSKCVSCQRCGEVCPSGVHTFDGAQHTVAFSQCTLCGKCIAACHYNALMIMGREYSVEEILKIAEKDKRYYDLTGGGVTLSGGEPTMQSDFVAALAGELHEAGLHVALDTSGYAEPDIFRGLMDNIDLFLYDIKHMDSEKHREYTGVPNTPILSNLAELAKAGKEIRVRYPLIPGYNDDEENLSAMAAYLNTLGISEVDVLPYHTYGLGKAKSILAKLPYIELEKPSDEYIESKAAYLVSSGIKANIL